ncbi:MAG TPA: 50S ribosomal protein L11 methyltransferase [Gammaproteobacteria bacterium]|nr:50S ribosomal protein L11 methyltransferase [Gammaproteobacteria bacterium]
MAWQQISFEVAESDGERAEEVLSELGALSVTLRDAEDQPIFEPPPGATPLWARIQVVGLFDADIDMARVRRALTDAFGPSVLEALAVAPLEDRDWVRAWMDDFHPMQFGARLWVCPSGYEPPDPSAVNLYLDPGLAFGTGTHATTALCLQWLDAHPPVDAEVIDYGCGSGILAVAGVRLGARHVWAVDNDPQALVATRDNAQRNGVADSIDAVLPEGLPAVQADLLLANILAGPLLDLAPVFADRVRSGGSVVLSGILENQVQPLLQAYGRWFEMGPVVTRDGWTRLVGMRRNSVEAV